VNHDVGVADFLPQGVEENNRIDRIEPAALPFADLIEDGVGDPRNQVRQDVDPVKLGEIALDLLHRHAGRV
jgi:hypothetical protein